MIAHSDIPAFRTQAFCKVHDAYFIPANKCRGVGCDISDWRFPGVDDPSKPVPAVPIPKKPRAGSAVELALYQQLNDAGFFDAHTLGPVGLSHAEAERIYLRQYPFGAYLDPPRGWTFDAALFVARIGLEVVGAAHIAGKARLAKDVERERAATLAGWRVMKFTHDDVKEGRVVAQVEKAMVEGG